MIGRKVLIVPENLATAVAETITKYDCWDAIDMVIVKDEDYDKACATMMEVLPAGKILREISFMKEDIK